LRLVLAVTAGAWFVSLAAPNAATAVSVTTDPFAPQYVVSGAVLLDKSFDGGVDRRRWASTCTACEWVLTDPCLVDTPNGRPQICGITGNPCPPPSLYQRVWFRDGPTMAWDPIGLTCTKTTTLTPVRDVQNLISIRDVRLPGLRPRAQPSGRAFAGLPVWFASNQPRIVNATVSVLGWDVDLQAAPTWSWTYGDGATLATTDPGGRYPLGGIHHIYRSVGKVRVTAIAMWSAQWSVQDLPARPVDGTITQVRGLNVDIRPTRPILVPTVR
jgi:hypothetical protein